MEYAFLPERSLLSVAGTDAFDFLQGLVSNNVMRVKEGRAVYAALLMPQGKFLHDFFLLPWQGGILLDCATSSQADLLQRLAMYKLRSKVAIEAQPQMAVAWSKDSAEGFIDPRLPQLGFRLYGNKADIQASADAGAYEKLRLELGVPDGSRDMISGKSLLLEFGFEDLHGVDFSKGCYVGQEVTARSKHRAQLRRFIYKIEANSILPEPGTPVYQGETAVGEIRSSLGNIGLALLAVAAAEKGGEFHGGKASLKAALPPWVIQPPKALTIAE